MTSCQPLKKEVQAEEARHSAVLRTLQQTRDKEKASAKLDMLMAKRKLTETRRSITKLCYMIDRKAPAPPCPVCTV